MKRILALILFLSLVLTGCGDISDTSSFSSSTFIEQISSETVTSSDVSLIQTINGADISSYTIVFQSFAPRYVKNAAKYIQAQILERTGVQLNIRSDTAKKDDIVNEIVVGETNREISKKLDAKTTGVEFSILADGTNIALEGNYFSIAAAAYYFVETYITKDSFLATVPDIVTVCQPIVREPKNYILMIGDGMGVNQTKLFESEMSAATMTEYSDEEDIFYGYLLPYKAFSKTNSLSGTTDSAAGATALSTGYKTYNKYVGLDQTGQPVPSLTEIAGSIGLSTAIMSTDLETGATPAAFSAHCTDRELTEIISASQEETKSLYKTIIKAKHYSYSLSSVSSLRNEIKQTLQTLPQNEKGFFFMYEESSIDWHCHENDLQNTFRAVVRFNQAISTVMEYAFYNPDTMVIITADHETGGLERVTSTGTATFSYSVDHHTSADVPVFVYGKGGEVFDGKTIENIQIPKTLSAFWGETIIGYDNTRYPALQ